MPKVALKSGKWTGSLPGGDVATVSQGDVLEVTDEQAAYLTGEDCAGDFAIVKEPKAAPAPKAGKD